MEICCLTAPHLETSDSARNGNFKVACDPKLFCREPEVRLALCPTSANPHPSVELGRFSPGWIDFIARANPQDCSTS